MSLRQLVIAAITAAALSGVFAGPAGATHSWGGYHWARTANPFTVNVGDNVSPAWDAYLDTALADWSADTAGNPLNARKVAGTSGGRKCPARSGRVEVCNYTYGRNGWLGIASISIAGSHITAATTKLNDTYYSQSYYNKPAWRGMVVCQEVGHDWGLDHQDESGADFHTCMDYASSPDADNMQPNLHDYEELSAIYFHLDSSTTISSTSTTSARSKGLKRIDDDTYVEDFGNGRKRLVHVLWVDRQAEHRQAPEGA